MAEHSSVKNKEIKTIFKTMEYGQVEDDVTSVKDWLKKRNNLIFAFGGDKSQFSGDKKIINNINTGEQLTTVYLPDNEIKQKIFDSLDENNAWANLPWLEKSKLLKKFASEIQQNADLICKIESCTRGLLSKDTKKFGMSYLAEYLQYFANWAFSASKANNDLTIVYATDNTCLGLLGFALGPALVHGSTVILHVGPTLSVCVALLIELSVKAGIPDGVIRLLPNYEDLWIPSKPAMVYLFGDFFVEKFENKELYTNKQVVAISNSKTPMIVFNNSDLDSACECAISAIWEYGGMLPWSVNTILVQEDIYIEFVEKIKRRIKKIRIGNGVDKLADISYPMTDEIRKIEKMIEDACAQGIDVYQPHNQSNNFQPTLFIGAKVYNNNVLMEDKNISVTATILAFRTPKEATALANNTRQGLAASVWCDNINLVNEVSRQLSVGTVWINSHGIIKANVPFTTCKLDGVGYFGGPVGFYEYEDQFTELSINKQLTKFVLNAVSFAQKAQVVWNKLPVVTRIEKLSKWALDLTEHKSEILNTSDVDGFISKIYECIIKYSAINTSSTTENFQLIVNREAVGVVVLVSKDTINVPLTVGSLLLGNAVVLITTKNTKNCEFLGKFLPSGLLTALELKDISSVNILQTNSGIMFVGNQIEACRFKNCYNGLHNEDFVLRRCTLSKNVWITFGDSVI